MFFFHCSAGTFWQTVVMPVMISHDPIITEPMNISDTKITKGTGNWVIFGTSQAWLHFDYLHSISLGTKWNFAIKLHQEPFLSKLHRSVENGKWKTNENERVDSRLHRLAGVIGGSVNLSRLPSLICQSLLSKLSVNLPKILNGIIRCDCCDANNLGGS